MTSLLPHPRLLRAVAGYAGALGAVAVLTVVIAAVLGRTHLANISMLYLVAVLATAVAYGRGPAIFSAIAAFVAFDFFFVDPVHTFAIADPEEWVALLLFLVTAVITGQLGAEQRRRAEEAEAREREAVVLYDVARLMGQQDLGAALQAIAERLRQELQLAAVLVDLSGAGGMEGTVASAGGSEAVRSIASPSTLPASVLQAGPAPTAVGRGAPGRWMRVVPPHAPGAGRALPGDRLYLVPVDAGGRRAGVVALLRGPDSPAFGTSADRLLSAVAAQLGLALERVRLRREATEGEALRRTDELKTALLHAVSHNLRTPLASIITSAGTLRQEEVDWSGEQRRELAETIEQEGQRLNRIIGNLLDLSRLEAGGLQPERDWYDLGGLIDDVAGRLRPITAAHRVVVEVPEGLPPVLLDYVEIDQALSNLIENAACYAPAGTEIRIAARRRGEAVEVEVTDEGPGIAPEALPHLFEVFYRAEPARRQVKGTGLGLAVARGLIEAHGGAIRAENRAGRGARFVFTLPVGAEPRGGPESRQAAAGVGMGAGDIHFSDRGVGP